MKLAERYKVLEQTLREMQDALRAKDKEIESLRKERDRLIVERDKEREVLIAERDLERQKRFALQELRESEGSHNHSIARDDQRRDHLHNGSERTHRQQESSRNGRYRSQNYEAPPPLPLGSTMTLDAETVARARGLDVFLTKADNWSGAQVIQAVEDINAEILQFAASATESCIFAKRAHSRPLSIHSAMLEDDRAPWLGPAFTQLLSIRDHAQDPTLVQLALQASVATCCARSLSLFCVGFPSKLDGLLSRVFAYMQTAEPQATSALWRALTHRSVRMLYPGLEEYAVTELVNTMLKWSATVLTLSGASSAADSAAPPSSAGPSPSLGALRAQLRRIAEAVYKLARVTREEILSTRFDVVLVENGEPFEEGFMANKLREYGEWLGSDYGSVNGGGSDSVSNGTESGNVWCTTELGLRCITRKDIKAVNSGNESEIFESRMLLLPKVVLDSAVDAMDRG